MPLFAFNLNLKQLSVWILSRLNQTRSSSKWRYIKSIHFLFVEIKDNDVNEWKTLSANRNVHEMHTLALAPSEFVIHFVNISMYTYIVYFAHKWKTARKTRHTYVYDTNSINLWYLDNVWNNHHETHEWNQDPTIISIVSDCIIIGSTLFIHHDVESIEFGWYWYLHCYRNSFADWRMMSASNVDLNWDWDEWKKPTEECNANKYNTIREEKTRISLMEFLSI